MRNIFAWQRTTKKGEIELMVSNLSWFHEHQQWDVQSSNCHDFSATSHHGWHSIKTNIHFIYSMSWTNQFVTSFEGEANQNSSLRCEWITHIRDHVANVKLNHGIEINTGVHTIPLQSGKAAERIFLFLRVVRWKENKTKKRCNKYFKLTFFLFLFCPSRGTSLFSPPSSALNLFICIFHCVAGESFPFETSDSRDGRIIARPEMIQRKRKTN